MFEQSFGGKPANELYLDVCCLPWTCPRHSSISTGYLRTNLLVCAHSKDRVPLIMLTCSTYTTYHTLLSENGMHRHVLISDVLSMDVATFGAMDFLGTYYDWLRKIAGTRLQPEPARGPFWYRYSNWVHGLLTPDASSNTCSLSFEGFMEAGRPASRRGLSTLGNGKAIAMAMLVWSEGLVGFFISSSSNKMTGLHVKNLNLKQHPKGFNLTSATPWPQGFHKRLSISAVQVPFAGPESRCPYSRVVTHTE